MSWIEQIDAGVVVKLRVVPRASRNELSGLIGDELKVRLQSPPVEGKANKALVKFLAARLGVSANCVSILSGASGRNKRALIRGSDVSSVRAVLSGSGELEK